MDLFCATVDFVPFVQTLSPLSKLDKGDKFTGIWTKGTKSREAFDRRIRDKFSRIKDKGDKFLGI